MERLIRFNKVETESKKVTHSSEGFSKSRFCGTFVNANKPEWMDKIPVC